MTDGLGFLFGFSLSSLFLDAFPENKSVSNRKNFRELTLQSRICRSDDFLFDGEFFDRFL